MQNFSKVLVEKDLLPTQIFPVSSPTYSVCLPFSISSVFLFSICLFIQFVSASYLLFFFFYCPNYATPAAESVTSPLLWH